MAFHRLILSTNIMRHMTTSGRSRTDQKQKPKHQRASIIKTCRSYEQNPEATKQAPHGLFLVELEKNTARLIQGNNGKKKSRGMKGGRLLLLPNKQSNKSNRGLQDGESKPCLLILSCKQSNNNKQSNERKQSNKRKQSKQGKHPAGDGSSDPARSANQAGRMKYL